MQRGKIHLNILLKCLPLFFSTPVISIELKSYSTKNQNASPIDLNLEKCLKIGIQNSLDLIRQKNSIEISGFDVLRSYGNYLPNLALQFNNNYSVGTNYLTTTTPTYVNTSGIFSSFSLSSTFNIFNGFSDRSILESYIHKKNSAELTFARAKQIISIDIIQNYLQIVLDNKMMEIATQNLQEFQAREKLLNAQSNVGSKSIADLYLQQAQTSLAESNLNSLKNKLRNDEIILLQKLRLDYQKNYKFAEINIDEIAADSKLGTESELVTLALQKRPDLKSLQNLKKSFSYDIETAQSTYYPKIDFVMTATSNAAYLNDQTVNGNNVTPNNQDPVSEQIFNNMRYIFGINFTWTLFDKLISYSNENQAKLKYTQSKIEEDEDVQKITGEIRIAHGNLYLSTQELESSAKVLFASKKAYQVMNGRYKVGSASFVDLITAQSALEQAEYTRVKSLINFLLQKWNMKFVTGIL